MTTLYKEHVTWVIQCDRCAKLSRSQADGHGRLQDAQVEARRNGWRLGSHRGTEDLCNDCVLKPARRRR